MTNEQWKSEIHKRADWLHVELTRSEPNPNTIRRDAALLRGDIIAFWTTRDPEMMTGQFLVDRKRQLLGMEPRELLAFANPAYR